MTTTLPPPTLRDDRFASPVAIGATRGVWTAVPVLLPIPDQCVCVPGGRECLRCAIDADVTFERGQDA